MVGYKRIVDDGECDDALHPRERVQVVAGHQEREHEGGDAYWHPDEARALAAQQGAIGRGAIGEIGRAQAVPDPEAGGDHEVERVDGTVQRVVVPSTQPPNERGQPQGVQHPQTVPQRGPHPAAHWGRINQYNHLFTF